MMGAPAHAPSNMSDTLVTPLAAAHYTRDWFQPHVRNWERWLSGLRDRPSLRALEIGSFEGRSTVWLLQNVLTQADSRIDCVDLFRPDPLQGDYHQRFRANVAPWSHKVREYAGPSAEQLGRVRGPYDLIYIDGWHTAFGALADGVMAWPQLKVGGLMIFDDYLWMPPAYRRASRPNKLIREFWRALGKNWRERAIARIAAQTPKLGIDVLLSTLRGQYELVERGYQLAIRKTRAFEEATLELDT